MTLSVDLFFSFRSPYSYLALRKIMQCVGAYNFVVNVRPVYPLAVRVPDFFERANPQFAKYVVRDSKRVAEYEGIPFRFPRPDPIVQDMSTLKIAPDQPRIRRLTRLGAAAQDAGRALAFVTEVSAVLWDGTTEDWDAGDHLAHAAHRAGFRLADMDAAIGEEPDRFEAIIEANQRDHTASGHWGVPTFVFAGEPFFGQDRIDLLLWRLKQHGLTAREQ